MQEGLRFLDQCSRSFTGNVPVHSSMAVLVQGLSELKKKLPDPAWTDFCHRVCGRHQLREILNGDPFTRRSFEKPRGYPGDAVLLDYIYRGRDAVAFRLGRQEEEIFHYTTNGPAPQAVKERRRLLSQQIDCAADRFSRPEILAVASGHLREAELSLAFQEGRLGRLVALDQDRESLQQVAREYGLGVETVEGSIQGIIADRLSLGRFHLIYAAGLYDYLPERIARRLTAQLFRMLHPGGRFVAVNFTPGHGDQGYMEAFMGWKLIYRDSWGMSSLAGEIPRSEVAARRLYQGAFGNTLTLELDRRG